MRNSHAAPVPGSSSLSEFATLVRRELPSLLPGLNQDQVSITHASNNPHSWTVELAVHDYAQVSSIVGKRPKLGTAMEIRQAILEETSTASQLETATPANRSVGFPAIAGTLLGGTVLVIHGVEGVRLDEMLTSSSRQRFETGVEALTKLSGWLRDYHSSTRVQDRNEPPFPFGIRRYQTRSCKAADLDSCLRRVGVTKRDIQELRGKFENLIPTLPAETLVWTRTIGDFRVWNVMVGKAGIFLLDYPSMLCLDRPWRDLCALLTSLEYVAARPRGFLSPLRARRSGLADAFLRGYLGGPPPPAWILNMLELPGMLASLEDLREDRTSRAFAARVWISRRVRRIAKTLARSQLN